MNSKQRRKAKRADPDEAARCARKRERHRKAKQLKLALGAARADHRAIGPVPPLVIKLADNVTDGQLAAFRKAWERHQSGPNAVRACGPVIAGHNPVDRAAAIVREEVFGIDIESTVGDMVEKLKRPDRDGNVYVVDDKMITQLREHVANLNKQAMFAFDGPTRPMSMSALRREMANNRIVDAVVRDRIAELRPESGVDAEPSATTSDPDEEG